jgi:acyl-CoA thioesterase FadM
MNLWLRALRVIIWGLFFKSKLRADQESVVSFVVMPHDLDPYMHMNNGRYLTILDLGRTDIFVRTPLLRLARKHGWWPVVAATNIRYKRPLPPFRRFQVHTRVLGWDDKGFYIDQYITSRGVVTTQAVIKAVFPGVSARTVVEALGLNPQSPPLPPEVACW